MSQTQGAVRVPAASSFTLSWEGLEAPSNYKEAFNISITDYSATLSCSAGSSAYGIYFVSSAHYFSDYSDPKKIVGASGSEIITSSVSLNGKTLCLTYTGTFAGWNTFYVTFYDPVTLTAPSNFKASQSGQMVNLSWTGSSASGGNGSIVYKLYNVSDGTVVTSTTATSLSIAASTLGYASCQYKIIAEYGGHSESSNVIWINPQRTSLTAPSKPTVTISGNKFTISWSAASGAYGTGDVTYVLHYGNKAIGYFESDINVGTARTYTIEFSDWSMQYGFTVTAYYSGVEATGETTYITTPTPSLTKPGAPQVSQTGRKLTVTWSAAKGSSGVGSVYYYLFAGSEDNIVYQGTGTSATITPPAYDESKGYFILATYCNAEQWSSTTYFTASSPKLTAPGSPMIRYQDGVFTLSWSPSVGSYGDTGANVTYTLYYGDSQNGFTSKSKSTGTATSVNIASWAVGIECRFFVRASYAGKTADGGYSSYTIHDHNYVAYYDETAGQYVLCIPYYCENGVNFIEVKPSYCPDGQSYIECSN